MPAKLIDLEATFIGAYEHEHGWHERMAVDGAQGVQFICPKCGNHSIVCWFSNPRNAAPVPDAAFPRPGRWAFTGDTIETLTLHPSIDLSGSDGCKWHGSVKDGVAS